MTGFTTFVSTWSAVVVTLVTLGTMPALAASPDDAQAPRATTRATVQDTQAPRGQDAQAPRGQDHQAPRAEDAQAPRGQDAQAPRSQDDQAPATVDDTQSPRGARS